MPSWLIARMEPLEQPDLGFLTGRCAEARKIVRPQFLCRAQQRVVQRDLAVIALETVRGPLAFVAVVDHLADDHVAERDIGGIAGTYPAHGEAVRLQPLDQR